MIELKFPLQLSPYGNFVSTSSYAEIWQQRVTSTVATQLGTRVMRPTFGGEIGNHVFENMQNSDNLLQEKIRAIFGKHFPDLFLDQVEIVSDDNSATLTATIWFSLPNRESTSTKVGIDGTSLYERQFDNNSTILNIVQPFSTF